MVLPLLVFFLKNAPNILYLTDSADDLGIEFLVVLCVIESKKVVQILKSLFNLF